MAITVKQTVSKLLESHFTRVREIIDPADGTSQLAYSEYLINTGKLEPVESGGKFSLPDTFTIEVKPSCRAVTGVKLTKELIAHEQFHYEIGTAIARQFAREVVHLSAKSKADLITKYKALSDFHFTKRSGLINERYDKDTAHGTNARYQRLWLGLLSGCLANSKATQIGGWFL